jgi:hypothetical protein
MERIAINGPSKKKILNREAFGLSGAAAVNYALASRPSRVLKTDLATAI